MELWAKSSDSAPVASAVARALPAVREVRPHHSAGVLALLVEVYRAFGPVLTSRVWVERERELESRRLGTIGHYLLVAFAAPLAPVVAQAASSPLFLEANTAPLSGCRAFGPLSVLTV